jgi:hypothetical protein
MASAVIAIWHRRDVGPLPAGVNDLSGFPFQVVGRPCMAERA